LVDIAAVVGRSGVPASTLRFYEQKGLLSSAGRRGQRRLYAADIFDRLALITLGRIAGFSLNELAAMLGPDGPPRIDRAALHNRAVTIDDAIDRLTAISTALKHAAACPAPNHMECSSFRGLLEQVAAGTVSGQAARDVGE